MNLNSRVVLSKFCRVNWFLKVKINLVKNSWLFFKSWLMFKISRVVVVWFSSSSWKIFLVWLVR